MEDYQNHNYAVKKGMNQAFLFIFLMLTFLLVGCNEQKKEQEGVAAEKVREMIIPVEGMSCNACVANIKSTLKPMEGVHGVAVSLEQRNANIAYEPEKVTPEQVQQAINALGFKAGEPITKKETKQ